MKVKPRYRKERIKRYKFILSELLKVYKPNFKFKEERIFQCMRSRNRASYTCSKVERIINKDEAVKDENFKRLTKYIHLVRKYWIDPELSESEKKILKSRITGEENKCKLKLNNKEI